MADEPAPIDPSPTPEPTPTPEVVKTEVPAPKENDPVPYERFSDVNNENKELKAWKAQKEAEEAKAEETRKLEAGKHEEVIAELRPKAEEAEALKAVIQKNVDTLMADIPDDKKALVPTSLPVQDQLDYINANRAILFGDAPKKNVGNSSNPPPNGDEITDSTVFTTAQIKDPKFYRENEEAIKKAQREGRIRD